MVPIDYVDDIIQQDRIKYYLYIDDIHQYTSLDSENK